MKSNTFFGQASKTPFSLFASLHFLNRKETQFFQLLQVHYNARCRFIKIAICFLIFMLCGMQTTTYAQISGAVFRDFNGNGVKDNSATFNEPFVANITVKAYNTVGALIATQTSAITGTTTNYAFPVSGANSIASGTAVRLEFSGTGAYDFTTAKGAANATDVQFVTAPSTTASFAFHITRRLKSISLFL